MFCSKRCVNASTMFWMRKEQLTTSTPYYSFTRNSNLYAKLGLKPNATKEEIKQAYYQKCKDLHPDRNPSKEAMISYKDVQDAYEILSSKSKRQEYDKSLQAQEPDPGFRVQNKKHQGAAGGRKRHPFHTEDVNDDFLRKRQEFDNLWGKYGQPNPGDDYNKYTYRNFKPPHIHEYEENLKRKSRISEEQDFWTRHRKRANNDPRYDKFENFLFGEPDGVFTRASKYTVFGYPAWKFIGSIFLYIFLFKEIMSYTRHESVNLTDDNNDKPK